MLPKCNYILLSYIEKSNEYNNVKKLKILCAIRLIYKCDIVSYLDELLLYVTEALNIISNWNELTDAFTLSKSINTKFIISLM